MTPITPQYDPYPLPLVGPTCPPYRPIHTPAWLSERIFGAFFSRRVRVCSVGDGSSHLRPSNRYLRRCGRERADCPSVGACDTRRTARRCDRRAFRRYSSRENSTGWQAEEGGDDTNRPAPEVPVVLRGRTAALAANDRVVPE